MKFKNYVNSYTGDNRIYSLSDITQMALGDLLKNKEELLSQYRVLGVPTEAELQSSENVVYVRAYTRDDGTVVKAHYRSKPYGVENNNLSVQKKSGTPTGGASKIDDSKYTLGAWVQENAIKRLDIPPIAKIFPEQEYYKISFELKKVEKNGKIPKWILDNNDVYKVKDIDNNYLFKIVKSKIIKAAKEANDIKTLNNINNVFVVQPKNNTKIVNIITNSPKLRYELSKNYLKIKSGKYVKNNTISIEFPQRESITSDYDNKFTTYNTIHYCDLCNVKIEKDGRISMNVVDYYDFNPGGNFINDNAYRQQINHQLVNYVLIVPIIVQPDEWRQTSKYGEITNK